MIIFIYGADTFRSRRKLNEIRKNFQDKVDVQASSISVLDGTKINLKEISEQINTGSLFVKKRLVTIEGLFKNKQEKIFAELKDYLIKQKLENLDGRDVLIFYEEELNTKNVPLKAKQKELFNFLAKQKLSQEFKLLSNAQLNAFVRDEFIKEGRKIKPAAIAELITRHQGDLWQIQSEIKKLAHYKTEGEIDSADLEAIGSKSFGEDIFSFTDVLGSRNHRLIIKIFEEQLASGLSIEQLLAMITRHFKILIQIKSFEEQKTSSQIASELKLHPFVVSKSIGQTKNFSISKLIQIHNRLIELDYKNKSGQGDLLNGLTLLLSSL